MGKGSEPMRYAVNRLEGAILRGMEHALAVQIAPVIPEPLSNTLALLQHHPYSHRYSLFLPVRSGTWI
jgi:hypothetical protein